ncbi:MAG: OmpA family protein [Pseudomonadota bacterium]
MPRLRCAIMLLILAAALLSAGAGAAPAAPGDVTNAQDPARLPRPAGYVISAYESDAQAQEFFTSTTEKTSRSGRRSFLRYEPTAEARPLKAAAILAHYAALVQALAGRVVYAGETAAALSQATYALPEPGGEAWLMVEPSLDGSRYDLTLVQPEAAASEASGPTGAELLTALKADGRLALYLDFDPGRAELKPEFAPVLELVAALMRANPGLRLGVEAHTDDQGGAQAAQANLALSQRRAEAVKAALVEKGVEPGRLAARGWGQARPLTANDTAQGRAQNRRVELVGRP